MVSIVEIIARKGCGIGVRCALDSISRVVRCVNLARNDADREAATRKQELDVPPDERRISHPVNIGRKILCCTERITSLEKGGPVRRVRHSKGNQAANQYSTIASIFNVVPTQTNGQMFRIDLGRNQRDGVPGSSERVGVVRRTTRRNSKKVGQVHIVNATDASDQKNLGVLVEPCLLYTSPSPRDS